MTLEDFERTLREEKKDRERENSGRRHDGHGKRHHRHKHRGHEDDRDHHRHKRRRRSTIDASEQHQQIQQSSNGHNSRDTEGQSQSDGSFDPVTDPKQSESASIDTIKRDAWMEQPSALDIDFTQRGVRKPQETSQARTAKADFELRIHENELNKHHLQKLADGEDAAEQLEEKGSGNEVDYTFGDAGAAWRMTKLKGVYTRAQETGEPIEEIATKQYGDISLFDHAREERTELDRRKTYGHGYARKEKPSGELFQERRDGSNSGDHTVINNNSESSGNAASVRRDARIHDSIPPIGTGIDQTALNKLKAKMMKAKLQGGSDHAALEAEYNTAMAQFSVQDRPDVVVLSAMDNRMLAGQRGEVRNVTTQRGQARGLVEENEDMTIEDMVREERRMKGRAGGDGQRFAERIAKDAKFDNGLEYLDENATKLAKRVHKSDINLRNMAISDYQRLTKVLETCPLCHHEDSGKPPLAPVISLATRVYLTLPTDPEISSGGCCVIPIQHRDNLLHCDEDEWEEIRNFMKSLTRMYHEQGRDVIFYENAAAPHRKRHAGLEVVPLPYSLGETAPAFFKEALLTTDEEWTQHKKIIDTLSKAKNGLGKSAFRRSLPKELPYFHVWFEIDGGLGHIVEDHNRWPKGDLFAREIVGGMLDRGPEVIKRQGRWHKGADPRADGFRRRWKKFDWTRVLHDA